MEPKPFLAHDTIRVLYANDAACALFHCEALSLASRSVPDLIVGTDFRKLADIHMRILREQDGAPEIEYPFLRCDDTVFWAVVTSSKFDHGIFAMFLKKTFEEWW